MAFDRTDPADLLALKTEVITDPIGMGYDPSNTQKVLKPINDPIANVGGETTVREFDVSAMLDALEPLDLGAQQTEAGAAEYLNALIGAAAGQGGGSIAGYKAKFRSMFAANSATVAALDGQVRILSRAEVLFGNGTTISKEDWFAARDS